ncbi:MAG: NUDIX domain-containing protein [Treponema sp.]|nr:NUDIX domain-containing protein [Treponema sp.]
MQQTNRKTLRVVAAVIFRATAQGQRQVFATARGYGDWKGWWEFPGGKIEAGESSQEALVREIREELASKISVGKKIADVEWDYPDFHLSMQCFECALVSGGLDLLEAQSAAWLGADNLRSVKWLPADEAILDKVAARLNAYSTYAVSLCFDDAAAQSVKAVQERLAQICGNNFLIEHSVPPHVTLGAFHAEPGALPKLQKAFDDFAKAARDVLGGQGLDLEFGGTDSFLGKVVFLAAKKDSPSFASLKMLNEILHQKFLPLFEAGSNKNYLPERWLPHAALLGLATDCRSPLLGLYSAQGGGDSLGLATDSSSAQIELPQSGRVAALSLALCKPYKELCRAAF